MLLIKQLTILSFNGLLAPLGIFLIVYGIVAKLTAPWPPVEAIANWVSQIVTLIATFLIAMSIYFPINTRKPDRHSFYITAPITMLSVLIALGYIAKTKDILSVHIIN